MTEGPHRKPAEAGTKAPTLYNALIARLAELMQCERGDVLDQIVLPSERADHSLANLSIDRKRRLLLGLDLQSEG